MRLHRELDNYLGDDITRETLPRKNTLKRLKKEYIRQQSSVRCMGPIEKIEWLENQLDPSNSRNTWLFRMLDMQRRFLLARIEEM